MLFPYFRKAKAFQLNYLCELLFRIAVWTIYTRSIFSLVLLKIFCNFRNTSRKNSTQKQPFPGVLQDRCPGKVRRFYKKTPVLQSLFKKVSRNKNTPAQVFSCEFCEAFKKPFLQNASGGVEVCL